MKPLRFFVGLDNRSKPDAENPNGFSFMYRKFGTGGFYEKHHFTMLRFRLSYLQLAIYWYLEGAEDDYDIWPPFKCDTCGRVSTFPYETLRICSQCADAQEASQ